MKASDPGIVPATLLLITLGEHVVGEYRPKIQLLRTLAPLLGGHFYNFYFHGSTVLDRFIDY
jgi:hypothetical protein